MCRGKFALQKMMKMLEKKTIAIVGATEKTGKMIAAQFSLIPHRLLLVSNDPEELNNLSENISEKTTVAEIDKIDCVKEGCWEADIIILAVPLCEEKEAAEQMKEVATQKIVVIISDGNGADKDLKKVLPHSKLVNVSVDLELKKIFISGADETVNKEIMTIFIQAGFSLKTVTDLQESNK